MDPLTQDKERTMLLDIRNGAPVSLESALLVLSGLQTDRGVLSYQHKIDDIFSRFQKKCDITGPSGLSRPPAYLHGPIAECLFKYLWTSKPKRFGDHFLLADVVDAQLDPDVHRTVGTCVGLTSLYSVLGLRAGLNLSLLVNSDHLLGRIRVGGQTIDVDHTDPQGFDCVVGESFREFALLTLTANVLNSRGLRDEKEGEFAAAGEDYDKAVLVNPEYANARNNRGNIRFRENDLEAAVADYTGAIRLNPAFREAWCNRGMANQRLGRRDEARRDYDMAVNADPDYEDARECLRLLDQIEQGAPQAPCRAASPRKSAAKGMACSLLF